MKKLFQILGMLFLISGAIFLLIYLFVVTGNPDESFARDLFGFPIPHPPLWTSYIPYLGFFIGIVFEFFSIHGLVGVVISGVLFYIGGFLIWLGNKKGDNKNKQREIEEIIANPNLPGVIKQELVKKFKK